MIAKRSNGRQVRQHPLGRIGSGRLWRPFFHAGADACEALELAGKRGFIAEQRFECGQHLGGAALRSEQFRHQLVPDEDIG
jgi:hypothetical protein